MGDNLSANWHATGIKGPIQEPVLSVENLAAFFLQFCTDSPTGPFRHNWSLY